MLFVAPNKEAYAQTPPIRMRHIDAIEINLIDW